MVEAEKLYIKFRNLCSNHWASKSMSYAYRLKMDERTNRSLEDMLTM